MPGHTYRSFCLCDHPITIVSLIFLTGRPIDVYQTLVVCELLELDKPGKMFTKDAAGGCTTDELCYFNNNFTYTVTVNITQEVLKPHLEEFKQELENVFYKVCIDTLKNYLKKRQNEVNRKGKYSRPLLTTNTFAVVNCVKCTSF